MPHENSALEARIQIHALETDIIKNRVRKLKRLCRSKDFAGAAVVVSAISVSIGSIAALSGLDDAQALASISTTQEWLAQSAQALNNGDVAEGLKAFRQFLMAMPDAHHLAFQALMEELRGGDPTVAELSSAFTRLAKLI